MPVKTYRPRVSSVQAIQVTPESAQEAATWCAGKLIDEKSPFDETVIQPGINVPTLSGVKRASQGDYILKNLDGGGFQVMNETLFEQNYERPTRG